MTDETFTVRSLPPNGDEQWIWSQPAVHRQISTHGRVRYLTGNGLAPVDVTLQDGDHFILAVTLEPDTNRATDAQHLYNTHPERRIHPGAAYTIPTPERTDPPNEIAPWDTETEYAHQTLRDADHDAADPADLQEER